MKRILAVAAAAAALTPFAASAQFAKPEDAIKYRQAAFAVMGAHFGRIGAMVNGRIPYDAKAAADNAALVVTLSKLPGVAFPVGSEAGGERGRQAAGRRRRPGHAQDRVRRGGGHLQRLPRRLPSRVSAN
jgi:cytochrome c556